MDAEGAETLKTLQLQKRPTFSLPSAAACPGAKSRSFVAALLRMTVGAALLRMTVGAALLRMTVGAALLG
jgi:hypothetical protein